MNLNNFNHLIDKINPLEFLTFLVSLIILFAITIFFNTKKIDKKKMIFFLYGLYSVIFAFFFTNLESLILNSFFNLAEHISYLIAAIFFFIGTLKYDSK